jgi:phospholipid/cholesterol/gamma-HCH transport system substrate-binding protein
MSPARKNVIVGITALGALAGLAAMLLAFGGTSIRMLKSGQQIDVHFVTARADGLADGAQISYRGVSVGRVTGLQRAGDGETVDIQAEIDNTPPLPSNLEGIISASLISGISNIQLELVGAPTATPEGHLADGQKLSARYPADFAAITADLQSTTKEIREAKLVAHVDEAIRGVQAYVNDQRLREDITTSLEHFRHVSESMARSADNVEKFSNRLDKVADEATSTVTDAHATILSTQADVERVSKQIDDRMQQVTKSLDSIVAITAKVNAGQGTAGLLVNDPKLYESLVDNSRELNATIADLRRLVEQWEQEGVSFKLK